MSFMFMECVVIFSSPHKDPINDSLFKSVSRTIFFLSIDFNLCGKWGWTWSIMHICGRFCFSKLQINWSVKWTIIMKSQNKTHTHYKTIHIFTKLAITRYRHNVLNFAVHRNEAVVYIQHQNQNLFYIYPYPYPYDIEAHRCNSLNRESKQK